MELQLELIDDWRIRLLQLLHETDEDPLTSLMPCILNTLHYVATVLEEWGVTVVSIFKNKYIYTYLALLMHPLILSFVAFFATVFF